MLCMVVAYTIKPGCEDEAARFLSNMVEPTRAEPGNIMYIAHRSPDDPRRFMLYEQYTDQAALDEHRASAHFQQFVAGGLLHIAESRVAETYELLA